MMDKKDKRPLEEFREMIIDCLTAISNNEGNKWNSTTMSDAFGLLCAISSFAFIVAFQVNRCTFEYTVGLQQADPWFYGPAKKSLW